MLSFVKNCIILKFHLKAKPKSFKNKKTNEGALTILIPVFEREPTKKKKKEPTEGYKRATFIKKILWPITVKFF